MPVSLSASVSIDLQSMRPNQPIILFLSIRQIAAASGRCRKYQNNHVLTIYRFFLVEGTRHCSSYSLILHCHAPQSTVTFKDALSAPLNYTMMVQWWSTVLDSTQNDRWWSALPDGLQSTVPNVGLRMKWSLHSTISSFQSWCN